MSVIVTDEPVETRNHATALIHDCPVQCVFLVVKRRPITELPWFIRWLLRTVYFYYSWAASACGNRAIEVSRLVDYIRTVDNPNPRVLVELARDIAEADDGGYFSIEYQGVYASHGEAYYVAKSAGFSITELPFNNCLPSETCQFRCHDFPLSDATTEYRSRKLTTVAIPRKKFEELENKLSRLSEIEVQ